MLQVSVLVLRDERGDSLVSLLAAHGRAARRVAPLRYEPVAFVPPERADWAIITSAATVAEISGRWPQVARVAAVGPATSRALLADGVAADLVAPLASGVGLADALPPADGLTAWLPRSDLAGPVLPQLLADKGYRVLEQVVYRTVTLPDAVAVGVADADLVVVYSPSAARTLPSGLGVGCIAIGEPTAAALRERGLRVHAIADRPTDDGVLAAITGPSLP